MSEICKTSLKKRIAEGYNPDIGLEDEMGQSGMTETSSHSVTECNTDAKSWIAEICAESRRLASHRDNLHFLPELLPHLIRMCSYLPIWTGVMVEYFVGSKATASRGGIQKSEYLNMTTCPYAGTVLSADTPITSKDRCGSPLQRSQTMQKTQPNEIDVSQGELVRS